MPTFSHWFTCSDCGKRVRLPRHRALWPEHCVGCGFPLDLDDIEKARTEGSTISHGYDGAYVLASVGYLLLTICIPAAVGGAVAGYPPVPFVIGSGVGAILAVAGIAWRKSQ